MIYWGVVNRARYFRWCLKEARKINILVTGGARSGKSTYAEELAKKLDGTVLFVATAEAGDEEMKRRIEMHKRLRPDSWRTLEVSRNVGSQIKKDIGRASVVIVDCITLLVNNILCCHIDQAGEMTDIEAIEQEVVFETKDLIDCMTNSQASFIVVTNEVGTGLIPANPMGRLYRDLLGKANQMLARHVGQVYLLVAGLPLQLKPS